LRSERISGLDEEQLDELEYRVAGLLEKPWDKGAGRPRELTLREALVVTCGYLRQNIIEDVWADIFDVDQSTISRYITLLTPLVENATEEDRPTEEDAAEATRDAIALVDGTLWPCWSWDGEDELWAGKYKTTGHGSLIVTNLQGRITFVSEPVTGNRHDMAKLKGSVVEEILKKAGGVFGDKGFIGTDYITTPIRKPKYRKLLQWEREWNKQVSSFRAPVERAVANLKTWRTLFTDYRRPLKTFKSSFRAAIGGDGGARRGGVSRHVPRHAGDARAVLGIPAQRGGRDGERGRAGIPAGVRAAGSERRSAGRGACAMGAGPPMNARARLTGYNRR